MTTSIIIGLAVALFIAGTIYSNARLEIDQDEEEIAVQDHWYGPIYINPGDKRAFLPKRYGAGYTVNFGNTLGVLVSVAFLGFIGWVIWLSG